MYKCSFCEKGQDLVKVMLVEKTVDDSETVICDECVELMAEIVAERKRMRRDPEHPDPMNELIKQEAKKALKEMAVRQDRRKRKLAELEKKEHEREKKSILEGAEERRPVPEGKA